MGGIGGLLGALFNHINIKLTNFRNNYVKSKFTNILEVVLFACASSALGFLLSFYLNSDCQPIGRDSVSKYPVQLFCDDGQYNAMLSLFFQTPEASVRRNTGFWTLSTGLPGSPHAGSTHMLPNS